MACIVYNEHQEQFISIIMTFIEELKAIIAEKHLLNHPFYQMWEKGTLPIEVMQKYAEQYYHLETAFPTFLSRMHADCSEFEVRQEITQNQHDEEAGEENHRELWLRFGEGVGSTREDMVGSKQLPETKDAIAEFHALSSEGFLEGSGALGAYESQLPEVSKTKIDGLEKHYGVTDDRTQKFFKVHGVMDIAHAQAWWDIIEKYADTAEKKEAVKQAVARGRDALWGFLDGVCREYMPEAVA